MISLHIADNMPPLKTYSVHNEFADNCRNGNGSSSSSSSAAASPNSENANIQSNAVGCGGGARALALGNNAGVGNNPSKTPSYCNAQFPFKVLSNLNQLREQSRFCDVEIIAGGTTFSAHRAVLSAASAYFEAMFRPELGLNEVKQKSVVLHTIDGEILSILLEFIYTGRCEITQVS